MTRDRGIRAAQRLKCGKCGAPTRWGEVCVMREVFIPTNIDAMMMLPKRADYVNLHPHTFHVVQCPSAWDMQ